MAKELFNSDFYTLPEQVQINKDDIKTNTASIATNTADIAKLKDDIGKIKPNAWAERKFNIGDESGQFECTTYNPVIDINVPVNAQKTFTDKDTYSLTEPINSYSCSFSFNEQELGNIFTYAICVDPSFTLTDMVEADSMTKNGIILQNISGNNDGAFNSCNIYINCKQLTTEKIKIGEGYIEGISNAYDTSDSGIILSASVINYNYLKKSTASDIYLSKTDASNTYATMNALKPLQNTYFEADLTTAGLAKIQANATIGTSITLLKDTDFIENITNTDLSHRTVIFTLYRDDNEEVYISENIKLDIVDTTDYYSNNDQPHTWFTGLGVIKLGSASASGNNYLCYIAYDTTSTRGLMITPVQKLN